MLDKFYRNRYKILGGPGCGKTTKLLEILSDNIKGGLQIDQALLIGFARATVQTLQKRAVEEKKLTEKQAESITTIHKFCLDKIGRPDVLNSSAKTSFRKKLQTDPDNWIMLDDENYNPGDDVAAEWTEKEDKKLAIYYDIISKAQHEYGSEFCAFVKRKKAKNKFKDELGKSLDYFGESENDKWKNVLTPQLVYFYSNLHKFKSQNGFVDFDDMLLKALYPNVEFPSYKLVLVDEVQDLSRLEWQVISKIGRKTEELYLVGDDDQAIYGWKGSDVRIFQKWPCKKENIIKLEKSYRLPGKIYDFAISIRDDIKHRLGNEFKCAKRVDVKIKNEGSINYIYDMSELDKEINADSDVIFCARTNGFCKNYAYFLMHKGLIFKEKARTPGDRGSKIKSSFPDECRKVIESWNTLQEGHSIKGPDYIKMVGSLDAKKYISDRKKTALINKDTSPPELWDKNNLFSYEDLKTKYYLNADINKSWHEVFYFDTSRVRGPKKPYALFRDKEDFNDYLKRCWEKNKNLETKIIVSSIHGVKGMEADKVVLGVEWGYSLNSYLSGSQKKEDEENRVAYVGVTRCKNKLYLFELPGDYKNPFPPLQNYVNNPTPDYEKIKEKNFNESSLDSFHRRYRPDWPEIENPINNDRRLL